MTFRAKLIVALTTVALVPMGVALALPMLQAEARAREAAMRRLEMVRRQAGVLIEGEKREVAARGAPGIADLGRDGAGRQLLRPGPAGALPPGPAPAPAHGLGPSAARGAPG